MFRMIISIAIISLTATATIKYAGTFRYPHPVLMLAYQDRETCRKDGGSWHDDACHMDGEDRLEISRLPGKAKGFRVYVTTLGGNAHTCEFTGTGTVAKPGVITARSEDSPGCLVTVTYSGPDAVSVSATGECRYFCGANASLDIEKAKRGK